MNYRTASTVDAPLLAEMNRQLIVDEGHRNRMSLAELEDRIAEWLRGDYRAALFEDGGQVVGYALYRTEPDHVYLRQFFVVADRRRQGVGRAAFDWLRKNAWQNLPRIRLDVLISNQQAIAYWRTIGFRDYCLTMELE